MYLTTFYYQTQVQTSQCSQRLLYSFRTYLSKETKCLHGKHNSVCKGFRYDNNSKHVTTVIWYYFGSYENEGNFKCACKKFELILSYYTYVLLIRPRIRNQTGFITIQVNNYFRSSAVSSTSVHNSQRKHPVIIAVVIDFCAYTRQSEQLQCTPR